MKINIEKFNKKNICFTGMMGAGKSVIGREFAKNINYGFIDTDKLIEEKSGKKINKIFENYGEDYFRKYEEKIILDVLKLKNVVISLGGGSILNKSIRKGTLISEKDLYFRRTSQSGLSLEKIKQLQSKFFILKKNLNKNQAIKKEYFRKSKIALIVGGRLKSSRLKKKAIRLIAGKPSIQRCLESSLKNKNAKIVVLATSYLKSDKMLRSFNLNGKVKIFCGNPQDVISRYLGVCDKYNIDIIIRATADCPYVSNEITTTLLKKHFETGSDYTCASNAAAGTAAEIYNTQTLKFIKEKSRNTKYSEYMTWYVLNNKKYFKTNLVKLPTKMSRRYRLCIDYPEDLKMFNKLYDFINKRKLKINLNNIFKILDKNKEIVNINKDRKLIYKSNKKLIKFLNNNTKI